MRSFILSWLLPALVAALIVWVVAKAFPLMGLAIGLIVAGTVIWSSIRLLTTKPPVVVDEPGLTFSDAGDGPRLVRWESISQVMLFEVPRINTNTRRWQAAIGAGLVGYPDGVSVYRPLAGWSLDRLALERAVARFGGGGVKVVNGPRMNAEPTAEQTRAEVRRIAVESNSQDGTQTPNPGELPRRSRAANPSARYQPTDPAAYLARLDLRSNLSQIGLLLAAQVFVWMFIVPKTGAAGVGAAVIAAIPLVLIWRNSRSGGVVALAVDRPGVFLGHSHSPGDDPVNRLVSWADITAVVIYDQLSRGSQQSEWRRAVGVRLRGEQTLVGHWRIIDGWRLDRQALEAAVSRFAAGTPVLDGPPQQPPSTTTMMQAQYDTSQDTYGDQDRRGEG